MFKIALARLQQPEDMDPALFTNDPNVSGDGLFMEWAVGKNGDEMRPDSGRLMLPGSKITWEMHYHAVGEEAKAHTELAVWYYPKGQEPKHRQVLGLFNTFSGTAPGARALDIPPNQVTTTESFVTLKENARLENFQAHMHFRGKGMSMEAIFPDGRREMLSQVVDFNFNWHNMYIYADDVAPLPRVVRQHEEQQVEPGSGSVGRLGRSHRGRNGPRVDQHHLLQGRRVQGRTEKARHDGDDDRRAATVTDTRHG